MDFILKFKEMKDIKKRIEDMDERKDKALTIHYACGSFYESQCRIVSIAIKNLESGQIQNFSISKIADEKQKNLNDIDEKKDYDDLEIEMLKRYFNYIENRPSFNFIHWNMRNAKYGFKALEDRFETLTKSKAYKIPDDKKFDLANELVLLYGEAYSEHGENGRLISLIKLNNLTFKDGLSGIKEIEAFKNKRYKEVDFSTIAKVDCIQSIFNLAKNNSLKTSNLPISNRLIMIVLIFLEFIYKIPVIGRFARSYL